LDIKSFISELMSLIEMDTHLSSCSRFGAIFFKLEGRSSVNFWIASPSKYNSKSVDMFLRLDILVPTIGIEPTTWTG